MSREEAPAYEPQVWARGLGRPVAVGQQDADYRGCLIDPEMVRVFYEAGETGAWVTTYREAMFASQAEENIKGQLGILLADKPFRWLPPLSGELVLNGLPRNRVLTVRASARRFYQVNFVAVGKALILHDRTITLVAQEPSGGQMLLEDVAP